MLSQYFTHADSAANLFFWLQLWAATHQFRSPKYVHENERVPDPTFWAVGLCFWMARMESCTQSSKGIQATAVAAAQ